MNAELREPPSPPSSELGRGAAATLAAFLLWGIVPIYWKHVGAVPPIEMLGHRVIWGIPFIALLLRFSGGFHAVRVALRTRRVVATLVISACLIATNWWFFISAVADGQVLEASLGYYINPILNVFLGFALLGERPRRRQWIAIALAAAGVTYLAMSIGSLPWIALILAVTFGLYGLVRKTAGVDALPGLFIEVLLLTLPALGLLWYLGQSGQARAPSVGFAIQAWLPVAGLLTALPLWWFSYGARRLRLATVGLLQFIAPTGQFLLAVLLYGEVFTQGHQVAFVLIWLGIALYLFDLRSMGRARARLRAP